jgi:hypothetical protein
MNLCPSCGEEFGGVGAFDVHRVGEHLQHGPSEYRERVARGLAPPPAEREWTHEMGRRCLDLEELLARGFVRNARGAWSLSPYLTGGVIPAEQSAQEETDDLGEESHAPEEAAA